ncbi:MAG: DoxX family membrane protein [Tomitella sp.]|nr:DoxX family membrane protein [Tomitella sp.]
MLVRRIARPLLASIFVVSGIDSVRNPSGRAVAATRFAERNGSFLPTVARDYLESDPENVVRANGLVHAGGGLLLATGKFPRFASTVLAASMVPTTVAGHPFWEESDPEQRHAQQVQFFKNLSLTGGLLITAVDTEGKPSLGWRGRRAARHARAGLDSMLPTGDSASSTASTISSALEDNAQVAGEHTGHLAEVARKRGEEFGEVARKRGEEFGKVAKRRGADFADVARKRGAEWAETASHRGSELAETAGHRGAELLDRVQSEAPAIVDRVQTEAPALLERAQKEAPALVDRAQKEAPKLRRRAQKRAERAAKDARKAADEARSNATDALNSVR